MAVNKRFLADFGIIFDSKDIDEIANDITRRTSQSLEGVGKAFSSSQYDQVVNWIRELLQGRSGAEFAPSKDIRDIVEPQINTIIQNRQAFIKNPASQINKALTSIQSKDFEASSIEDLQRDVETLDYLKEKLSASPATGTTVDRGKFENELFGDVYRHIANNLNYDWKRLGIGPEQIAGLITTDNTTVLNALKNDLALAITKTLHGDRPGGGGFNPFKTSDAAKSSAWDETFTNTFNQIGSIFNSALNLARQKRNQFQQLTQTTAEAGTGIQQDIENIKTNVIAPILTAKTGLKQKQSAVSGFISGLPSELQAIRDPFVEGLKQQSLRQFQEFIPTAEAKLAAKGRFFGGGLPAILGETAIDIAGKLQEAQTSLQSEDDAFIAEATFQNIMNELLRSQLSAEEFIGGQRKSLLAQQKQKFQTQQSILNTALKEFLSAEKLERGLRERQFELSSKERERGLAKQEQLFQNIVNPFVQSVGAGIGSRIG